MKNITLLSFLLFTKIIVAQQLSGTLISKETQETIPFAAVQIGKDYGVITNLEGNFQIEVENFKPTDSLLFSSMGFTSKSIAIKDFKEGSSIYLSENINELDEVFLVNKNLSPEEIMLKVNENADVNYQTNLGKYSIFERESDNPLMLKTEFGIKKASFLEKKTRKKFNDEIEKLFQKTKNRKAHNYAENYYEVYKNKDSVKVNIIKATELGDPEASVDSEKLTAKVMKLIAENLDTKSTFKVKTGIIPIEDSLKVGDAVEFKDEKIDSATTKDWRSSSKTRGLSSKSNILRAQGLDFINDYEDYTYKVDEIMSYNGEMVYVMGFEPDRGRAKYKGQIYVSAETFAVLKADYQLAEGKRVNSLNLKLLLGIKVIQDKDSGMILFRKNNDNKYEPLFIRKDTHQYIYLNRNFTFKENVDDKKDRVVFKFEFLVETENNTVNEYLFVNHESISEEQFNNFREKEGVIVEQIRKYNPSVWEGYNIIAPSKEIEEFEY
ncbi:carboxypeptidase-like regulatory domain-containing protein [Mesonia sp. K7]|uniref:carboxypeptidase-like regulatory domain-containing protein n=1 Tax=Mesonia sp. K7 TaxID=2218606 RepID=UPI000DAA3B48|nr:carboxypeptidase-like regulatory domain-containing protein [Mesonia sp. K7]PZD76986.1 hypothetical protein DNG35_10100 [Mesonia sp. K7]